MTFSTAKIQPSLPRSPMAVPLISEAFAAYSIWKTLPSGENCEADKSYCKIIVRVNFMLPVRL